MKNIINFKIDSDSYVYITLNNKNIEEDGWEYSYCETPEEVVNALEIIFNKIKGEEFEIVREEID
jgi:hypothetical protein